MKQNKLLRREIHPAISPTEDASVIDFISSDETLDRSGEIILASGWRLENYSKNPVVQNAHNYGDILFTIGKALITEVRGRQLFQRIEFATEINPVARIAYGLYKGGFLNAVSVGFIPMRWEDGGPESDFSRKYLEQELVEVSAVGIPANPNALQVALQSGAVQRHDLEDLVERLESLLTGASAPAIHTFNPNFCTHSADLGADTRALGSEDHGAHWAQLTQLLNQTRAVLRRATTNNP